MKPRISKHDGLWYCCVRGVEPLLVGLGYTPAHAYAQWKALA
jgi:hypothetical protein